LPSAACSIHDPLCVEDSRSFAGENEATKAVRDTLSQGTMLLPAYQRGAVGGDRGSKSGPISHPLDVQAHHMSLANSPADVASHGLKVGPSAWDGSTSPVYDRGACELGLHSRPSDWTGKILGPWSHRPAAEEAVLSNMQHQLARYVDLPMLVPASF
jgi:hypothetical protein